MKQYKILFALLLLCSSISTNAQLVLYKSVLASGGGSYSSTGLSADWTIGQTVANQYTSSGLIISEGFHPVYIAAPSPNSVPVVITNITSVKTYPNPTNYLLNITIDQALARPVTIDVLDVTGKTVKNIINLPAAAHISTSLDLSALNAGIYIVRLNANTDDVYMMKVVKQ